MDIQARLDKWLAENPEAQKYINKIYYVQSGDDIPSDATHAFRVHSTSSPERAVTIGLVLTTEAAVFLDAILAMAATQ